MGETFEEFRESFSYGSRNDLSFKFLKRMSDEAAAGFLQELLRLLGDSYDTGDVLPLIRAAYEAQIEAYAPEEGVGYRYDDRPFTPPAAPLASSRVGLLTSSGHFVDDPQPLGVAAMTQEEAVERIGDFLRETPVLSSIPATMSSHEIAVRHGGYDIRSTRHDINVSFPIDRLREAVAAGRIGELAPTVYSFPGATAQGRLKKVLPEWVAEFAGHEIDVMLLVPV